MAEKMLEGAGEALSVVQVLAAGAYGGLESVVLDLAEGLACRGHRLRIVPVLDQKPDPHPFELALRRAGLEVLPIRLSARAYRRERWGLRESLEKLRPQVVHTHGYRADLQAGWVARKLGLATVSTLHGFTGGGWKMRLYESLQERALRRFGAVVAVSQPIAARLRSRGVSVDRLHLVRNAWCPRSDLLPRGEARRELGIPDEALVVGWVGRLSFEKGADLLLAALACLRVRHAMACFIGDGPAGKALRRRTTDLGLDPRVRWAGPRTDAGRLFSAFDAFVLSSRTEGTPIVIFEAAEAGVPIIASRVGGVPDVLSPETAVLIEPDRPEALARAIEEVLSRPEAAGERSDAASRRIAAEFALAPWLEQYERIYRSLLG